MLRKARPLAFYLVALVPTIGWSTAALADNQAADSVDYVSSSETKLTATLKATQPGATEKGVVVFKKNSKGGHWKLASTITIPPPNGEDVELFLSKGGASYANCRYDVKVHKKKGTARGKLLIKDGVAIHGSCTPQMSNNTEVSKTDTADVSLVSSGGAKTQILEGTFE